MKSKLAALSLGLLSVTSAFASSWNYVNVGSEDAAYYFDADTVQKNPNRIVLVWVKTVRTTKANYDGSWSTAARWSFNCTKQTLQTLQSSTYDMDGKFIRSYASPTIEQGVAPDTIGEGMMKIACDPSFPNDKSEKKYFKLPDNDPLAATKRLVEFQKSQQDNAPK